MPPFDTTDSIFDPDVLKNVAVDNVIFGYHEKELKVLLQRPVHFNKWTVTGGYINRTETIEEAAGRVAFSRTGLKNLVLRKFSSFGDPKRVKDEEFTPERLSKLAGLEVPINSWIFDYIISISFYTLTEFSLVSIEKGPFDEEIQWWPIADLPPLMFDHLEIITEALKALRFHIYHYPIGLELLPDRFTLPEIHKLYETILNKSLHSRNFTRKMLSTGIIEKLSERKSIGAHRSPFLYTFNKSNYASALESGLFLAF
jgi:8-oxo-dGTP diphosphatase